MNVARKSKVTLSSPPEASYETFADEYYDSLRHPTCANFRSASRQYLLSALAKFHGSDGLIVETGAGLSLMAEVLPETGRYCLSNLIISDSSESMLAHSDQFRALGATQVVTDACNSCFSSDTSSMFVASLGDPYNVRAFWNETRRALRKGGIAIMTVPSFSWAQAFRGSNQTSAFETAEFLTSSNGPVSVPSYILREEEQSQLIESAGFRILDLDHVLVEQIEDHIISPKLKTHIADKQPILTGYTAQAI